MATSSENTNGGLKTRLVFLDREVYRRYGHNLSDKVLQRLLQMTKDHISTLHITDITLEEIKRQLGDMAAYMAAHYRDCAEEQLKIKESSDALYNLAKDDGIPFLPSGDTIKEQVSKAKTLLERPEFNLKRRRSESNPKR